jgi:hypothetical protein
MASKSRPDVDINSGGRAFGTRVSSAIDTLFPRAGIAILHLPQ